MAEPIEKLFCSEGANYFFVFDKKIEPSLLSLTVDTTTMTQPFLNIVDPSAECLDYPSDPATTYSYPLDNFQRHAIAAIAKGENVLVTAKTGSGKTLVGEYQIAHSLAKGRRVFYTTPIKSLSNQKFHDLKEMYPGRVGILTGDIKFMPDAAIIVMTTEILRNLLYKKGTSTETLGLTAGMSLDGLDAVVFDEVHYINNKERGKVWEETLVLLPREIQLVLLSATIAAPEGFAGWLGALKQVRMHLISTTHRVVPLTHYIIENDGKFRIVMDEKEKFVDSTYRQWLLGRDKVLDDHADHKRRVAGREAGQVIGAQQGKVKLKSFTHQLNLCVRNLFSKELLPAIFFVFSRKDCERYAQQIEGALLDTSDAAAATHIFDFHLSRYKDMLLGSPQYFILRDLLARGIAFHHSGLLPLLKEVIEILFSKGLVRAMFCTETFAVGINMPTKTVVFLDYRKYCDEAKGLRMLQTDEYIQMAGRAGRRGKDKLGTVLYLPRGEPSSLEEVRKMMTGSKAHISSRMDFGYDFLLKALQGSSRGSNSGSDSGSSVSWKDVMRNSYWYKQLVGQIEVSKAQLAAAVAKMNLLGLTDSDIEDIKKYNETKGLLEYAVKDYRKRLLREQEAWINMHMGPRWKRILEEYPKLSKEIAALEAEIAEFETEGYEDRFVAPYVEFLKKGGFLLGDTLTQKGVCATEINEAHPILLAEAVISGVVDDLSQEEIIGFLSVFIKEGEKGGEGSPSIASLRISERLRTVLRELGAMTDRFWNIEKVCGIPPNIYWDLSTFWVEIGIAWLSGSVKGGGVAAICSQFGIFEGNLYKYVMSMSNMLEELTSVATLCEKTALLEKLEGIKELLMPLNSLPWSESLYLRL